MTDPTAERELVQDCVTTVGQILSNYQAALHLLEEAVPHEPALEALRQAAAEVFTPVLDACAGVAPGLEELVAESVGEVERPAASAHNLVAAERQRVAATHSRLIRRELTYVKGAEDRAAADPTGYRRTLVAAAERLDKLETGSHSAGALFQMLFDRWR